MRRRYLLAALLFLSLAGAAQPVSCDLSLSDNHFEDATGGEINANQISGGQIVRVRVVIGNFVSGVTAPAGHFRLRIGLGQGFVLRPGFNLATAPLSNYFNWSVDNSGSQQQIVGNSIASLPDGFAEYATFELKANTATTSTVSFNLLISNPPGTTTPLSDPSPANNTGSNTYTITGGAPLPVTLSQLNAVKRDCEVNVLWKAESQVNLKAYEIEVSKDNSAFTKLGEVAAKSDANYAYAFPLTADLKAATLYIRLKPVDLDGSFRYSKTVTVSGNCAAKRVLALYPNPVSNESLVTVLAREGLFEGKYKVSVISAAGQLVKQKEIALNGVKSFPLSVTGISAGKYHVRIESADGGAPEVLEFEKL